MSGWSDKRTSTQNSDEIGRSALSEIDLKSPDLSASDNNSSSNSSKFPLRRIGDLFRSKLRSSGSYSIRAINESVPQECKIADSTVQDVEQVSSPVKKPERPVQDVTATVAAVVVNEKPTRSGSTVVGATSSGGTALRARRMSTLNRTIQRQKSLIASINSEKGQTAQTVNGNAASSSNGHKRQSVSSQDTAGDIESDVVVGESGGRERINSTSHYSTEKSGSSGYYSTNIYFAGGSVVDDHIYYEPVVDRARKPPAETGNKPTGATIGKKEGILKNSNKSQDANKAAQKNGRTLEKYYYPATLENVANDVSVMRAKPTSNEKLTDITEGPDGPIPRPIWPLDVDDSLADINLEAFKMRNNSQQNLIGFESPASSNSDNEIYSVSKKTLDDTAKKKSQSQYEEYLEFHNTRNILEQIRGKLNTLLEQRTEGQNHSGTSHGLTQAEVELEEKITNLKSDLEGYLQSMNQKNENEIKLFCKGMSKDAKVVAVQNAVEQRNRSRSSSVNFENDYEVLENQKALDQTFYPTISQRTLSRYPNPGDQPSLFETVYVRDGFNVRQLNRQAPNPFAQEARSTQMLQNQRSINYPPHPKQLQQQQQLRYLSNAEINALGSYEACERRPSKVSIEIPEDLGSKSAHVVVDGGVGMGFAHDGNILMDGRARRKSELSNSNNVGKSGDVSDFTLQRVILMESLGKNGKMFGDKEKMLLEYHLNKPSYWELYYGANREEHKPHHTLIRKVKIGGKNAISVSYPSTRPESDFTLDLPRAEQLRVKMKKEKQFRNRCRWFFYFLSVVFFLLSVMVVSLVLTRGRRMFGSMI
ncbi:uncharacterized protein LOC135706785 [Ochlerotatus camptorhynchus]|uniref:uncharacterized protein LOC135706785 n=1 Tax=Ochlerotatus camptorhynchus TaxID=644619 RepID=UPI0031D2C83D